MRPKFHTMASSLGRIPLAGKYPPAAALALLALSPFLIVTTALSLMTPQLVHDLHATPFGLQLTNILSNAAYAFGTIVTADLLQRFSARRVYVMSEVGFVVSSILVLSAREIGLFSAGVIMQGLFTGILLIAAFPPLLSGHGPERFPTTGAIATVGVLGVGAIGPLVGGTVGSLGGWRPLYGGIAVLAGVGLIIGTLTFESNEPTAQGARFDWSAIPLAFGATALPFFGVSWLDRGSFADPQFIVPVVVGLLLLVLLVVAQYRRANPLVPVRTFSNTLPVTGTATSMLGGAAFTTLLELTEVHLLQVSGYSPVRTGALFTPAVLGVAVAALLFRRSLPTRWTPYLALSGLASLLVGGIILLFLSATNGSVIVPIVSVFLGYGAGAGVVPGLFLAGLAVSAAQLGPALALVELLRAEGTFLIGPVVLHLAITRSTFEHGFEIAVVIVLILILAGGLFLISVWRLGGVRNEAPDLDAWLEGTATAYHSPPLGAAVRKMCRIGQ
ncbi:Major Facilitator Superfamily protein [Actinacidiphila yanglinensis]|uniref:Major Facilitator Superfamily protein n=1 Tax=Actinacidiphila yanglinensis TaxID=310779 RepID=A0A1H6CIN2_9ACTN|nr:MFS transporter [Actinacidiphila yanglinensis]SEG72575.1 Major Facilitator Superfamily protein [Actinacidiphila yanglinensis]